MQPLSKILSSTLLFLAINLSAFAQQDSSIIDTVVCDSFIAPSGWVLHQTGIYDDTISNSVGGDSIITINLTVPNIAWQVYTTTSQTGATVFTNATSFQWLDCDKNFKVRGKDTTQSIYMSFGGGGTFACALDLLGCKDTTNCVTLIGLGLEQPKESSLTIYPNPTNGVVQINNPNRSIEAVRLEQNGRIIREIEVQTSSYNLEISGPSGQYHITVLYGDGTLEQKSLLKL